MVNVVCTHGTKMCEHEHKQKDNVQQSTKTVAFLLQCLILVLV